MRKSYIRKIKQKIVECIKELEKAEREVNAKRGKERNDEKSGNKQVVTRKEGERENEEKMMQKVMEITEKEKKKRENTECCKYNDFYKNIMTEEKSIGIFSEEKEERRV